MPSDDLVKDDMQLHWLGARISTVGKQNYDEAQQRINRMLEIKPESPLAHSEQIYMHLRKGDEELAFNEIDTYIESHPNDEAFKKSVAYDLNNYSNKCLYNDTAQNTSYIADKKSYDEYLRLNKKAVEVYDDEYTNNRLEHAKFFGKKEWNSWNEESIKALTLYGLIFLVLFWPLGLLLLAMDITLVYFSFRPYWQINKTYVTGRMGTLETIVRGAPCTSAACRTALPTAVPCTVLSCGAPTVRKSCIHGSAPTTTWRCTPTSKTASTAW